MKSAIITGATGFIGSWLTQELINNGYHVTVLVRDFNRLLPQIRHQCEAIEKSLIDVEDKDIPKCDVFYHLAWNGVAPSKKITLIYNLII